MFGLIARVPEIGEHVGPETFILGGHKARQVVAGLDLAIATQVVAVIEALALGQREVVPPCGWCQVCVSAAHMFASFQPRIPRRRSHGRQERKDVRLSPSSEFFIQTGRLPAELRQMFKSLPTQKVLLLLDACSRI